MNIISKEKKEIKWVGLPTNSAQECQQLEVGKIGRSIRVKLNLFKSHLLVPQKYRMQVTSVLQSNWETVNTRSISGMLLQCKKKANQV